MSTDEIYRELEQYDPKFTPLGHVLAPEALECRVKTVFGAIALPDKNPGFVAVAAMSQYPELADKYGFYLLDEYESFDMRTLIRQVGVLNQKYKPRRWIGDPHNVAADKFHREMNEETNSDVSFRPSALLDDNFPYQYIISTLKNMLSQDSRLLYFKESQVLGYLASIKADEIRDLPWGQYPAIEAVGMVAIELRDHGLDEEKRQADLREIRELERTHIMRWS